MKVTKTCKPADNYGTCFMLKQIHFHSIPFSCKFALMTYLCNVMTFSWYKNVLILFKWTVLSISKKLKQQEEKNVNDVIIQVVLNLNNGVKVILLVQQK